jgi:hypothetical protein
MSVADKGCAQCGAVTGLVDARPTRFQALTRAADRGVAPNCSWFRRSYRRAGGHWVPNWLKEGGYLK